MRVTIEMPATVEVSVRGLPVVIDLASAKNVEEFVRRVAMYGFRKFNDASPAGAKAPVGSDEAMAKFKAECRDNAVAMVKDWLAGDFETERAGRESDPVGARARLIATQLVEAKYGRLAKDASEDAKKERAAKVKEVAQNDKVRAKAAAAIKEEQALADLV